MNQGREGEVTQTLISSYQHKPKIYFSLTLRATENPPDRIQENIWLKVWGEAQLHSFETQLYHLLHGCLTRGYLSLWAQVSLFMKYEYTYYQYLYDGFRLMVKTVNIQ